MKNLKLKVAALSITMIQITILLFMVGCSQKREASVKENQNPVENQSTVQNINSSVRNDSIKYVHAMINLPTMQCGTCKKNIESAVKKIDGVQSISVDKNKKTAHVEFDKSKTDLSKIEDAITSAGYDANEKKANPDAYEKLDDCCKLPKDRK